MAPPNLLEPPDSASPLLPHWMPAERWRFASRRAPMRLYCDSPVSSAPWVPPQPQGCVHTSLCSQDLQRGKCSKGVCLND